MAVNWTGSGSFLLSRHRRRQQASRLRLRHHEQVDADQDWIRNIRGGSDVPSELASSPPPEGERRMGDIVEAPTRDQSASRQRIMTAVPGWKQQARRIEAQQPFLRGRSFHQSRRWLLDTPNWVGAKSNQGQSAREAQARDDDMTKHAQPRPAPMLASSNHSK